MSINNQQLVKIAYLSRLQFDEGAIDSTTLQINKILEFVAQLEQVNTDNIKPMFSPLNMTQRLRDDIAFSVDDKDLLQNLAPNIAQGMYLVPTVIE